MIVAAARVSGSPPRVWGIPTERSATMNASTVHPHACGEYFILGKVLKIEIGSPPRVWGILFGYTF